MADLMSFYILLLIIGLVIDAIIISLFIYVAGKAWEVRPNILGAPKQVVTDAAATKRQEAVRQAWAEIEQSAASSADGRRLAVINADRLVDKLLKDAGYEGEGALERMKLLPGERVATAQGLMYAHRFRNRLVHEQGFRPNDNDLASALNAYKAFLTEVGYL